jgi:hypothetical protein
VASAVLGLWLAASPAAAAEREVLIWGGSSKPEEAQALKAELEKDPNRLPSGLGLAPGFPQLIESQSLQGLKPGFHIVILGFCAKAEAPEVLAALKAENPGAYARTVTVPEEQASACPLLAVSSPVKSEDLRRALKPLEKERGPATVLEQSSVAPYTGRLATLVRFKGRKGAAKESAGHALVSLVNTRKGLKVLGSTSLTPGGKKVELRTPLVHISPREAAVELILSFEEPDTSEGERGQAIEGKELELYHLSAGDPMEVLSYELSYTKSDVECTSKRETEYEPREEELHEGFYTFRVETVSSDGGCALTYWDRSQGEPPADLGTEREEKLYRWDGSRFR